MADAKLGILISVAGAAQVQSALAEISGAIAGAEAPAARASTTLTRLGESLAAIGKHALAFAAGNLLAHGVMGLEQRFMSSIEGAERLGMATVKLQRLVGGTAEEVSGLVAVFGRWGISSDDATKRLTFLSRGLAGIEDSDLAVGGKTVRKTLEGLGINTNDASGRPKSTVTLFGDIAESLKGKTETERTGALTGLFGRGASDMAPIFASGRAGFTEIIDLAQKYGLLLTGSNVEAVRQFSHAHHEMDMAIQGVGIQMGVLLMPMLTSVATASATLAGVINTTVVPAIQAIPTALGNVVGLMDQYKLATLAVGVVLSVALGPALTAASMGFAQLAIRAVIAATATLAAWGAAIGPVVLMLGAAAAAGVLLQKAWENNFLGVQQVVGGALAFVQDKLTGFLDMIAGLGELIGVHLDWREKWEAMKGSAVAGVGATGSAMQAGMTQLGSIFQFGGKMAGAALGEGLSEGIDEAAPIDKAIAAGKRLEEIIGHRTAVIGRENLDLKVQESQAQAGLIPLKERQAELDLQLLEMADKRSATQREGAMLEARMAAARSSNALEDVDFEERRLRAKIKADALGGRGVSGTDVAALQRLALSKPQLELDALNAGRPLTLLERQQKMMDDALSLKTLPLRAEQAGNALDAAVREREIGRLNAEIQGARLANAPELAGLEARKRALEDAGFAAAQSKADRDTKNGLVLNVTQHITANGDIDYDKVVEMTQAGVFGALEKAANSNAPATPPFTPGSRGLGQTGPY